MAKRLNSKELRETMQRLRALTGNGPAPARLLEKMASDEAVLASISQVSGVFPAQVVGNILGEVSGLLQTLSDWALDDLASVSPNGKKAESAPIGDMAALGQIEKVKVFTDGASKGNPGPAAIGIVFKNLENVTVLEEALHIGEATNNVAEYRALIAALEMILQAGSIREAWFFTDSELVVKQINGIYKIKNPILMPLVAKAQSLRRQLRRFQIIHVPREENKRADELANLAIKQARDAAVM